MYSLFPFCLQAIPSALHFSLLSPSLLCFYLSLSSAVFHPPCFISSPFLSSLYTLLSALTHYSCRTLDIQGGSHGGQMFAGDMVGKREYYPGTRCTLACVCTCVCVCMCEVVKRLVKICMSDTDIYNIMYTPVPPSPSWSTHPLTLC